MALFRTHRVLSALERVQQICLQKRYAPRPSTNVNAYTCMPYGIQSRPSAAPAPHRARPRPPRRAHARPASRAAARRRRCRAAARAPPARRACSALVATRQLRCRAFWSRLRAISSCSCASVLRARCKSCAGTMLERERATGDMAKSNAAAAACRSGARPARRRRFAAHAGRPRCPRRRIAGAPPPSPPASGGVHRIATATPPAASGLSVRSQFQRACERCAYAAHARALARARARPTLESACLFVLLARSRSVDLRDLAAD